MNIVVVPFSPRSFNGICADVRKLFADATIVPLVLVGDDGGWVDLTPAKPIFVHEDGNTLGCPSSGIVAVVANGGMTAQTVAAVRIASRLNVPLVNVQRDGVVWFKDDYRRST